MIEIGLVIGSPWVEKILAGEKTWEIRSKPNARTGRIALCRKGGPIVGTCEVGKSTRLAPTDFEKHFDKHRVPVKTLVEFYGDKAVYAWPLSDVRPLAHPIPYKHPGGGSWVTLSAANVPEYERLSE